MIPPNEAPALKMPCASARSREGNQSALALAAPGQLPASLTPSVARRKTSSGIERTSACAAIDRDQTTIERVKPIRVPIVVWSLSIRSEEHTSELQSLMRISYAVFCLKKKNETPNKRKPDTKKKNENTHHQ